MEKAFGEGVSFEHDRLKFAGMTPLLENGGPFRQPVNRPLFDGLYPRFRNPRRVSPPQKTEITQNIRNNI